MYLTCRLQGETEKESKKIRNLFALCKKVTIFAPSEVKGLGTVP